MVYCGVSELTHTGSVKLLLDSVVSLLAMLAPTVYVNNPTHAISCVPLLSSTPYNLYCNMSKEFLLFAWLLLQWRIKLFKTH